MTEAPLETCPKCNKPLIYLKVVRNKENADIDAICLDGHKKSFTTPAEKSPEWVRFMAKRILTCSKCGNPVLPDRNTVKRDKEKEKFKVRCRSGDDDKNEREIANELADAVRNLVMQAVKMRQKPFFKPFAKPGKPFAKPGRFFAQKPGIGMAKPMTKLNIPEACPQCNAPLKKEDLEKLRNNEVIECSYCGNAIEAKKEE